MVAALGTDQVRRSIWDRDNTGTAPGTDRDKDIHTPVVAAVPVRTVAQVHTAVRARIAVRTGQGAQLGARHSD